MSPSHFLLSLCSFIQLEECQLWFSHASERQLTIAAVQTGRSVFVCDSDAVFGSVLTTRVQEEPLDGNHKNTI